MLLIDFYIVVFFKKVYVTHRLLCCSCTGTFGKFPKTNLFPESIHYLQVKTLSLNVYIIHEYKFEGKIQKVNASLIKKMAVNSFILIINKLLHFLK